MNKTDLLSFTTIAEERSFTKAAERLHITQPALSKRIARLEEQFNAKLLERNQKPITLSQAGEVFLQHAQALINAINNCETEIINLKNEVSGVLKLGVSHHIGLHRLPAYLQQFTQTYPNVQLQISFVDSEKAYEMISKNELEIALATLAPIEPHNIKSTVIWNDPLAFVCSQQHPLRLKDQVTLETLSHYPAILPSESTYTGQLVERLLKKNNCKLEQQTVTNYLETIKMMTSIGIGWSVLPKSMLSDELLQLPIHDDTLMRHLGIIQNKQTTLSNTSKAFLNTLPVSP